MIYKIEFARTIESLEKKVNDDLQDGWHCQGGICDNHDPHEQDFQSK